MRAVISLKPQACQQRRHRIHFRRGLRRLRHRDARRRDQALQRHHRDDAEHDHDHEGTEIAAPEQHQRARAAAVRHHHAVAEQQPAEKHQRRRERRLQIDRLAEIDQTGRRQQLRRGHRHADRQRIGADQAAVAVRPPAAQAGEHAKAAQQADRAIDEADHQSTQHDNIGSACTAFPSEAFTAENGRHSSNKMQISPCYSAACMGQSTAAQAQRMKLSRARRKGE